MENELEIARKEGFSIQSKPKDVPIEAHIGDIQKEDGWIFKFYRDCEKKYWFEIWIDTGSEIITLHESVHGKKEQKKRPLQKR